MNIDLFMNNWERLSTETKQQIWRFLKLILKMKKEDYMDPREEEIYKIQSPLILQRIIAEFSLDGKDIGTHFNEFKARYSHLMEDARKKILVELL